MHQKFGTKKVKPRGNGGGPVTQSRITDFFGSAKEDELTVEMIQNYDTFAKIKFLQCNNQKRIEACEYIAHMTDKMDTFVVLGQEPSCVGFNITGLNRGHTIIQGAVDKPRTYVYAQ